MMDSSVESTTPTATLQQQLQEALKNQEIITRELKTAINTAESNPDLNAGLPDEYKKGFINCGNVLAFENNLYTVERENGEIVVKNIYKELVDKSAEAAAKASRKSQSLIQQNGGRRTRKQRKLSKKSLKKMSKKELLKMMKSMKKK